MPIQTSNPATGELVKQYDEMSDETVRTIIDDGHDAYIAWQSVPMTTRATLMNRVADVLEQRKAEFGRSITIEMGKPITASIAEIEKCAWVCRYYAEHAGKFLSPTPVVTDGAKSYVSYEPLGVILAVMPWNFPFWQVFRFAAPTLMAGNACILKHASNVPACALAIESVFREAGFPESLFRTLLISAKKTQAVIEHPRVMAVSLTGSNDAGSQVGSLAGSIIKKTVLELGGSDPFIVLDDADVEKAAKAAVTSRMINTGQSCIAAKRFICTPKIYDQFVERVTTEMQSLKVGNPLDPTTQIGPLAREDLRDQLHVQVTQSIAKGARLLLGGKVMPGNGCFYEPTIVTDVTKGMAVYDEEVFGPVAPIIRAADESDAIRIANDTIYGLGASLWTIHLAHAEELAVLIQSGAVFINGMTKSDPRLPFGGIKQSGYGRELGQEGIREFVNKKTVWVSTPA